MLRGLSIKRRENTRIVYLKTDDNTREVMAIIEARLTVNKPVSTAMMQMINRSASEL